MSEKKVGVDNKVALSIAINVLKDVRQGKTTIADEKGFKERILNSVLVFWEENKIKGNKDKIVKEVMRIIQSKLEPKDAFEFYHRGLMYNTIRKYDKAVLDFTNAIELKPKAPSFYLHRAYSYENLNKYDQAILDITKAIEMYPKNPKNPFLYPERARIYEKQGKVHLAIIDLTKAHELAPESLALKVQIEELKKKIDKNSVGPGAGSSQAADLEQIKRERDKLLAETQRLEARAKNFENLSVEEKDKLIRDQKRLEAEKIIVEERLSQTQREFEAMQEEAEKSRVKAKEEVQRANTEAERSRIEAEEAQKKANLEAENRQRMEDMLRELKESGEKLSDWEKALLAQSVISKIILLKEKPKSSRMIEVIEGMIRTSLEGKDGVIIRNYTNDELLEIRNNVLAKLKAMKSGESIPFVVNPIVRQDIIKRIAKKINSKLASNGYAKSSKDNLQQEITEMLIREFDTENIIYGPEILAKFLVDVLFECALTPVQTYGEPVRVSMGVKSLIDDLVKTALKGQIDEVRTAAVAHVKSLDGVVNVNITNRSFIGNLVNLSAKGSVKILSDNFQVASGNTVNVGSVIENEIENVSLFGSLFSLGGKDGILNKIFDWIRGGESAGGGDDAERKTITVDELPNNEINTADIKKPSEAEDLPPSTSQEMKGLSGDPGLADKPKHDQSEKTDEEEEIDLLEGKGGLWGNFTRAFRQNWGLSKRGAENLMANIMKNNSARERYVDLLGKYGDLDPEFLEELKDDPEGTGAWRKMQKLVVSRGQLDEILEEVKTIAIEARTGVIGFRKSLWDRAREF